jgi:uncharacterized protein (DUF885 family)
LLGPALEAASPPAALAVSQPTDGLKVAAGAIPVFVDGYLNAYFNFYPIAATAAGRHDLDGELEDLSPQRIARWLAFNRKAADRADTLRTAVGTSRDDRLDLELLARHARRELNDLETRRRPALDPLFWTGLLGEATLNLMLRDAHPGAARLAAAASRLARLPRLAQQAEAALSSARPAAVPADLVRIAADQTRGSAAFYRGGFLNWAAGNAREGERARAAAGLAAKALDHLAVFLDELSRRATGSVRLGNLYADAFRLGTGVDEPVSAVLARATADLSTVRAAAARYGRTVWARVFPGEVAPPDDQQLLRRLFTRVAADHARSNREMLGDYTEQVAKLEEFLRTRRLATLPDPLSLRVELSPPYLVGQSVGGVYAAGPYAPDDLTLWLLPTPSDTASIESREAFFRDFNHHFNVMITAHEIFPGHYMQLKIAAHQPHKVRALFSDDTYVEGWGTFCERLMLDQGWGGPLDRLAHLKKQMENVTRTIVDIRVHTAGMRREEVIAMARDQALQDEQFAANLWTRSITSAPQLTTYWLGDREVQHLYEDVRRERGGKFSVRGFVDEMMAQGPVAVSHYREVMLAPNRAATSSHSAASEKSSSAPQRQSVSIQ